MSRLNIEPVYILRYYVICAYAGYPRGKDFGLSTSIPDDLTSIYQISILFGKYFNTKALAGLLKPGTNNIIFKYSIDRLLHMHM